MNTQELVVKMEELLETIKSENEKWTCSKSR
jgi:hypothetical protein